MPFPYPTPLRWVAENAEAIAAREESPPLRFVSMALA